MLSIFSIRKKIIDALRLYNKATRVKTLQTLEEIEANTESHCLAGAGAVAELNNKLSGFEPVLDSTGRMTGYKTDVGGAGTVFPFTNKVPFSTQYRTTWAATNPGYTSGGRIPVSGYEKLTISNITSSTTFHLDVYKKDGSVKYSRSGTSINGTYDIADCVSIDLYVRSTGSGYGGAQCNYRLD